MEQFIALTERNLKTYLRDKGAVFFSLLTMIIVICLMVFFLGDMNIEAITDMLAQLPGRDPSADEKNANLLVLVWTSAGIVSVNGVMVTMSAYSVMIKDKVTGKLNSIYTAPISRGVIAASYIGAAWVASVIVSSLTLLITEGYGVSQGLEMFSLETHGILLGMIMVNSFVYATMMYLLALISKSEGAWTGIGTVIGTLAGFLGGIYIPIGALAESIGNLMKCTPVLYGTAMFRSVMTEGIMDVTFEGAPDEMVEEYRLAMGIDLEVFDKTLGITEEWMILFLCGILMLVVGIVYLRYSRKTDR